MDDMLEMKQRERLSMRECKGDYIKWNELSNQNLVDSLMMLGEDDLYAVTKGIKWKGHRCYLHTYYDSLKAELENKKFTHRLLQCYDELTSHNERQENQVFYDKYFFVRDFPKRERKVQYNEEAIRRHKQNHIGWLVIISNKDEGCHRSVALISAKGCG